MERVYHTRIALEGLSELGNKISIIGFMKKPRNRQELILLNHNLKGAAWVLFYCITFTFSMTLNKMIDLAIPTSLKVLIRACFGLLFFSPIILKYGRVIFYSYNFKLQLLRILYLSLAMGGTYFTYANLPFALAASVGFTGPIFTAVLSYFMLKDRLSWDQWLAIIVGYLGVLLMMNPKGDFNNAIYVAIFANIVTGISVIYTKRLTAVDSRNTIIILGNIGVIIASIVWTFIIWVTSLYDNPLASIVWVWPSWSDVMLLMGMGFLGALSQIAYVTALKYASPSFLSPFEYSRLVIAVPVGLAFGEAFPEQQEFIGIVVIILTTLYMSWRGGRHA